MYNCLDLFCNPWKCSYAVWKIDPKQTPDAPINVRVIGSDANKIQLAWDFTGSNGGTSIVGMFILKKGFASESFGRFSYFRNLVFNLYDGTL